MTRALTLALLGLCALMACTDARGGRKNKTLSQACEVVDDAGVVVKPHDEDMCGEGSTCSVGPVPFTKRGRTFNAKFCDTRNEQGVLLVVDEFACQEVPIGGAVTEDDCTNGPLTDPQTNTDAWFPELSCRGRRRNRDRGQGEGEGEGEGADGEGEGAGAAEAQTGRSGRSRSRGSRRRRGGSF